MELQVGVKALLKNKEGKYLLVRRSSEKYPEVGARWDIVGGRINPGTPLFDNLKREVKEETGLDVEVSNLTGIYSKQGKNDIVFSFACKIIGGEITLNDEADKIEYFEISKIPKNTVPKHVERIKDFLSNPDSTTFKVQGGKSTIDLIREGKL